MARPLRIDYPGSFHHIICRGNARQTIVGDDTDRERFLEALRVSAKSYAVDLHAFVLMANHFHLLVESRRGNISEFMRRFNISYTAQFNRRHKRSGHLYQGRFKSVLVDREEYLSLLSRYIHLNPVRIAAMRKKTTNEQRDYLLEYRWSSLPGYVAKTERYDFLTYSEVLSEYGGDTTRGRRLYRERVLGEIGVDPDVGNAVIGGSILGSDGFVGWVRKTFLGNDTDRETPAIRALLNVVDQDWVIQVICAEAGCGRERALHGRGDVVRDMTMELLARRGGMANVAIAKLMGIDYSTVSLRRKHFRQRVSEDRELRFLVKRIEQSLNIDSAVPRGGKGK